MYFVCLYSCQIFEIFVHSKTKYMFLLIYVLQFCKIRCIFNFTSESEMFVHSKTFGNFVRYGTYLILLLNQNWYIMELKLIYYIKYTSLNTFLYFLSGLFGMFLNTLHFFYFLTVSVLKIIAKHV